MKGFKQHLTGSKYPKFSLKFIHFGSNVFFIMNKEVPVIINNLRWSIPKNPDIVFFFVHFDTR